MQHKSANGNVVNGRKHNYGYNGIEENNDLGLDLLDTDFRQYDSAIGRFMSIDPLAELVEQLDKSPFAFAWNNPVFYNDPLGLCPDCPDVKDYKTGDTYQVNGTTYVVDQDGQWSRQGGELAEVVIESSSSSSASDSADTTTDNATETTARTNPWIIPVEPEVKPIAPPGGGAINPGRLGLLYLWALFYTPDNSPFSPSNREKTLNPPESRGLGRDDLATVRVQFQQGTSNIASTTANNTAQSGVTTLQADIALISTRQMASEQMKKVLKSPQAQRAFVKMGKKIQNAPAGGGIIAGTRTTLQETFIYNNKTYRIDVESIRGHNLRQ